jgi:hypothetical protein
MSELFQKGYSQKKRHDARKMFSDTVWTAHDSISWAFFGPENVDKIQQGICDYVKSKGYNIDRQSDREVVRIMIAMFVEYYMNTNIPQINRSGLKGGCSEKYTRMPQAFLFSDKMDSYSPPVCNKFKNDGYSQEDYQWNIPLPQEKCTDNDLYYQTKRSSKIDKINKYVQNGRCDKFWEYSRPGKPGHVDDILEYLNKRVINFIAPGVVREVQNYLMYIHDTNLPYRLIDQPTYTSTNNKRSIELSSYYSGENTRPHIRTCSTNRILTDVIPEEYRKQGIDYLDLNKLHGAKEFKAFDFKKQWGCPTAYGNSLN